MVELVCGLHYVSFDDCQGKFPSGEASAWASLRESKGDEARGWASPRESKGGEARGWASP